MRNIPTNISLQDWEDYCGQFGCSVYTHTSGAKYIHDNMDTGRIDLWHLTDYIVSSVCAGVIWLIKR
jgi:hypothetical protein